MSHHTEILDKEPKTVPTQTLQSNLNLQPNIEISDSELKEVSTILNSLLADEYVLYTKTRNAHWNVEGKSFMELHKLFESQYDELATIIDDVAERVRSLGHYALGSLKNFLAVTRLLEDMEDFSDSLHIVQTLLDDHETIIRILRTTVASLSEKSKDFGTVDFLTGLLEQHEKTAWMLRAHLA